MHRAEYIDPVTGHPEQFEFYIKPVGSDAYIVAPEQTPAPHESPRISHDERVAILLDPDTYPTDVTSREFIPTALSVLQTIATARRLCTVYDRRIEREESQLDEGELSYRLASLTAKKQPYQELGTLSQAYATARETSMRLYRRKSVSDEDKQSALLDTLEAFDLLQAETGVAPDRESYLAAREYIVLLHEAPVRLRGLRTLTRQVIALAQQMTPNERDALLQQSSASEPQPEPPTREPVYKPADHTTSLDDIGIPIPLYTFTAGVHSARAHKNFLQENTRAIHRGARIQAGLEEDLIRTSSHSSTIFIRDLATVCDIAQDNPRLINSIFRGEAPTIMIGSDNPRNPNFRHINVSADPTLANHVPKYIKKTLQHLPSLGAKLLKRYLREHPPAVTNRLTARQSHHH